MINKPPAFQFYADDFLAGTMTMTNEERGAYITMLCIQWSKGHVTKDEFNRIAVGMPPHSQAICQAKFQIDAEGMLRNARLESERVKQRQFREKQSTNAKNRWRKVRLAIPPQCDGYPTALPTDMPNACSPSPSPSSNTKGSTSVSVSVPKGSPVKALPAPTPSRFEPLVPDEVEAEVYGDPNLVDSYNAPQSNGNGLLNHPDIETIQTHWRKHRERTGELFEPNEVSEAFRQFEASKLSDGNWMWGKRPVGDWRSAMQQRMLDNRERRGGKRPPKKAGEVIGDTPEQILARTKRELALLDEKNGEFL